MRLKFFASILLLIFPLLSHSMTEIREDGVHYIKNIKIAEQERLDNYIYGVVRDKITEEGIEEVKISFKNTERETKTEKDGYFNTGRLLPGKYILTASKEGYKNIEKLLELKENDKGKAILYMEREDGFVVKKTSENKKENEELLKKIFPVFDREKEINMEKTSFEEAHNLSSEGVKYILREAKAQEWHLIKTAHFMDGGSILYTFIKSDKKEKAIYKVDIFVNRRLIISAEEVNRDNKRCLGIEIELEKIDLVMEEGVPISFEIIRKEKNSEGSILVTNHKYKRKNYHAWEDTIFSVLQLYDWKVINHVSVQSEKMFFAKENRVIELKNENDLVYVLYDKEKSIELLKEFKNNEYKKEVSNGFVIYEGRALNRPIVVECLADGIYVNGNSYKKYNLDKELRNNFIKSSYHDVVSYKVAYEELIKELENNTLYIMEGYYRTKFRNTTEEEYVEFYKNLDLIMKNSNKQERRNEISKYIEKKWRYSGNSDEYEKIAENWGIIQP